MAKTVETIDIGPANVAETGFFCYMSRRKSEGFRRKLDWVRARFAEGMKIKMLKLPERGFIEYLPGEFAWRALRRIQRRPGWPDIKLPLSVERRILSAARP